MRAKLPGFLLLFLRLRSKVVKSLKVDGSGDRKFDSLDEVLSNVGVSDTNLEINMLFVSSCMYWCGATSGMSMMLRYLVALNRS